MTLRNILALVLIVVSLVLLIPGLTRPMITISASIEFMGMSREILRETRSILQTVRTLHELGNDFVASLIFFFSVAVPFIKIVLLGVVAWARGRRWRIPVFRFVRGISKWAMADVFVVAVYIAYLSAKATESLDAELHSGFYWFTGYCLVSLLSVQLILLAEPDRVGPAQDGA